MALGITIVKSIPIKQAGGFRLRVVDFTYDATYAVGGYAVTPANLKLSAIVYVSPGATKGAGDTGFVTRWDEVNGKIMVLKAGTADSPLNEGDTNQTSLTGLKSRHFVVGY
jgi:hypothetical protein